MDVEYINCGDNENCTYEHYISLNTSNISCQNTSNVLYLQYGENHSINLSNYITADFELKNLEVIITENYRYFSLNNNPLEANKTFKILNKIIFYSNESKKFHIIFENQGIV